VSRVVRPNRVRKTGRLLHRPGASRCNRGKVSSAVRHLLPCLPPPRRSSNPVQRSLFLRKQGLALRLLRSLGLRRRSLTAMLLQKKAPLLSSLASRAEYRRCVLPPEPLESLLLSGPLSVRPMNSKHYIGGVSPLSNNRILRHTLRRDRKRGRISRSREEMVRQVFLLVWKGFHAPPIPRPCSCSRHSWSF
jgi:hypothetical protein